MCSHVCRFCGSKFETGVSLGGHVSLCKNNPARSSNIQKIAKGKFLERKLYEFNCFKCSKKFEIYLTEKDYLKGKHRIFCTRICANTRKHSDATKNKISHSMKLFKPKKEFVCVCGKKFYRKSKSNLCGDCYRKNIVITQSTRDKISKANKGRTGGLRTNHGTRFHGGYYKGIWMDSSWEIRCATIMDSLGIKWIRNKKGFKYIDINGKERHYYPDFYLPAKDLYVETKGYWTDAVRHKMKDALEKNPIKLLLLDSLEKIENIASLM